MGSERFGGSYWRNLGRTRARDDIRDDKEAQATGGANVCGGSSDDHPMKKLGDLQYRLTLRFSAVCTKPMNWCRVVDDWLVDKSERTNIHLLKLILLGLSVPCFHMCYFLFKLSFALLARQIIRLCRRYDQSGGADYARYIKKLGLDGFTPSRTDERLYRIAYGIEKFKEFFEAANVVNHQKTLSLEAELQALRARRELPLKTGHSTTEARERVLTETEGK